MIVDSSAIVAILKDEPEAPSFAAALVQPGVPKRMSAANWLESAMVIDAAQDPVVSARFDALIAAAGIAVEPVSIAQAALARQAWRDYGRASGHPAKLNFGDCFAYALARESGEPLLFKGDDFVHTDLTAYGR